MLKIYSSFVANGNTFLIIDDVEELNSVTLRGDAGIMEVDCFFWSKSKKCFKDDPKGLLMIKGIVNIKQLGENLHII